MHNIVDNSKLDTWYFCYEKKKQHLREKVINLVMNFLFFIFFYSCTDYLAQGQHTTDYYLAVFEFD